MLIIAIVIAAVVVATPLAAAVLVTFASLREDAAHSLGGRPPGWIEGLVRRLLGNANTGRLAPPRRRAHRGASRADLPRHVPLPRLSADDEPAERTLTLPKS
jgi:hypothetical protein